MVKNDTIYRKCFLNNSLALSKWFLVHGDTFKIISYHWTYPALKINKKILEQFIKENSVSDFKDSSEIFFTLNNTGVNFIKYNTTGPHSYLGVNKFNGIGTEATTTPCLFWLFINARFITGEL